MPRGRGRGGRGTGIWGRRRSAAEIVADGIISQISQSVSRSQTSQTCQRDPQAQGSRSSLTETSRHTIAHALTWCTRSRQHPIRQASGHFSNLEIANEARPLAPPPSLPPDPPLVPSCLPFCRTLAATTRSIAGCKGSTWGRGQLLAARVWSSPPLPCLAMALCQMHQHQHQHSLREGCLRGPTVQSRDQAPRTRQIVHF